MFEFLDMDLKKYMDKVEKVGDGEGLGPDIVKVSFRYVNYVSHVTF